MKIRDAGKAGCGEMPGTDTHRLDYKSPQAAVGAAALREKYGNEYADDVLYRNAEAFLR